LQNTKCRPGGAFVLATLVALSGCSDGLGPGQRLEVEVAREVWSSQDLHDYSFETRTSCFCVPELNELVLVEVRNDQVVAVTIVATGDPAQSPLTVWFTIDDLFDRILRMVDGGGSGELELEFDPELGYPSLVNSIAPPGVADGGSVVRVSALTGLP